MILDTYHNVFIWVGRGANEEEKKQSLTIATEYIKSDPSGRDLDSTSVIQVKKRFSHHSITTGDSLLSTYIYCWSYSFSIDQVKQGFEPAMFTCNFLAWNPEFWSQEQSYEEYKKSVKTGVVSASEEMKKYDDSRKLTYEELQGNPEGIDVTKKEVH